MPRRLTEDKRVVAIVNVDVHRRWPRTLQQLTCGDANATVTVVGYDKRRHEFPGAARNPNGETAQCAALLSSGTKAGGRECLACAERECIPPLIMNGTFHNRNDAPRSANVVPHCQRRTAIAEHEMHFVAVSPRLVERCGGKGG